MGALGTNSSYQPQAANQAYCVPGDTTFCAPPVGEWTMDEQNGQYAYDTSGNGNTGTLGTGSTPDSADPVWVSGRKGGALKFSNGANYVSLSNDPISDTAPALSFEGWVNLTATADQYMFAKQGVFHVQTMGNGVVRVIIYYDTTSAISIPDSVFPNNSWHYLAATYDQGGDRKIHLYLDGQEVAYDTQTPSEGTRVIETYYKYYIGGLGWGYNLNGKLDDVRIYNYVRTLAQIAWDYNHGAPVAWWKMDECTGGTIHSNNDPYNSSLNGTINLGSGGTQTTAIGNGTCTTNASTPWYNGRNGKYNASLNFDGTDDYVNVNGVSALMASGVSTTVSLWFKISTLSPGENKVIFEQDDGTLNARFVLWFQDSDNTLVFLPNWEKQSAPIQANTWYHVVVSVNGSTARMFLNGQEVGGAASYTPANSAGMLNIGRLPALQIQYFPGLIDDVRIYNYALTAQQVKTVMNEGSALRYGL